MGSSCDGICDRQVRGSSQYLRAPGPVEGSAPSWWTPGRATPHPNPRSAVALSVLAAFHPPAWPLLTPQRRQHQDRELPAWAPHPALYGPPGLGCCPRWDPGFAVVMPLPPDQKGADQAPAAKVPLDLGRPLAAGCFQPRGREAGPPLPHGPCRGAGHWLLSFKVLSDPGSGFMSLRWFLWITENYKSQGGSCGGGRRGGRALTEAQGQPVLCCPGPQSAQLPEQQPPNQGTGMACTGAQQRPGPGLAGGPLCPWGGWG